LPVNSATFVVPEGATKVRVDKPYQLNLPKNVQTASLKTLLKIFSAGFCIIIYCRILSA
jgi:hypothetical protein